MVRMYLALDDTRAFGAGHIGTLSKDLANHVINVPKHFTVIYIIRVK